MAARDRTAWLQGGSARCVKGPLDVGRTWRVVLLGPPGGGKGTQAELLSHSLGACPLSTGDVFRAAMGHDGTPGSAMAEAHESLERGGLAPDDVVLNLIRDRRRCLHCRGGFSLDGFPRTLAQARALDALLAAEQLRLDAVIHYEVSQELLMARLAGRRICSLCQAVFHVEHRPPQQGGVCDRCGGALTQRVDDRPEAIAVRLEAHAKETLPVIEHYRRQGVLVPVHADGDPVDIVARTLDALADRIGVS